MSDHRRHELLGLGLGLLGFFDAFNRRVWLP
jgi:hypothetical protein